MWLFTVTVSFFHIFYLVITIIMVVAAVVFAVVAVDYRFESFVFVGDFSIRYAVRY